MEKVLYTKSSDYRNKQTNLKTSIVDIDGKRYAKKDYVYPEGKKHLEAIEINQEKLKEIFEPDCKICPSVKKNESIYFDFIEGQSLEDVISDLYEADDTEGIKKLIDEYHALVWKMKTISDGEDKSNNQEEKPSSEVKRKTENAVFAEVFGHQDFLKEMECGSFVDADLIFSNIIKQDKLCIIDYEWCFNFEVPLKYIFWKGLFTSNTFSVLDDELKNGIYNKYSLDEETRNKFINMEENFVSYSKRGSLSFLEEVQNIHLVQLDVSKASGTDKSYPIVIFVKKSGEIVDEIHLGASHPGDNQVIFSIDKEYDTLEVFFAPDRSIITGLTVLALDNNQERKVEFTTTSETFDDAPEYFLRHTPVIIIKDCNYSYYRVEFSISVWNEEKLAKEELDKYLDGIRYTCKESENELIKKNREILSLGDRLSEKDREILSLGDQLNEKNKIIDSMQQRNVFKAQRKFAELRKEARLLQNSLNH